MNAWTVADTALDPLRWRVCRAGALGKTPLNDAEADEYFLEDYFTDRVAAYLEAARRNDNDALILKALTT